MPCILVADDNSNIQKMVSLALEDRGIKVVAVGNGEAAVRRLPDLNPDLVLADVFMPVRNGYEVCEFVKKDKRFAHIPVILLVGAFDPLDEKETRRVGADGVLKKPFVPPDPLIAMVISILEKNPRAAAELAAMKPKEAKDALEPHHLSQLEQPPPSALPFKAEVPLKIEPKPLPEFPEPSPEEAALMYGFGRGRRTLEEDDGDVSAAPALEAQEAAQEDFDGSSTTNDWRRNARDFEVPAEAANTPAFSPGQDLEPMSFPSENESRVERLDVVSDSLDATLESVCQEPLAQPEAFLSAPEISQETRAIEPVQEPEPVPEPHAAVEETKFSPETPSLGPESQPESKPELSFASRVTHWMDLIASPLSQSPASSWMDALFDRKPVEVPPAESTAQHVVAGTDAVSSESDAIVPESGAFIAEPQAVAPESDAIVSQTEALASSGQSAFANSESTFLPEAAASSQEQPDFSALAVPAPDSATVSAPDSANEEAPVSPGSEAQAFPNDDAQSASADSASAEEPAPLFIASSSLSEETYWEEPVTEAAAVAQHSAAQADADTSAPSFESSQHEVDDRIPTAPPLFREELADIPFLVRPPSFDPNAAEFSAEDSETVDAIVKRVLERLEPQLHALLSQGVLKPLVEDLLHSELAKKEK